MVQDVDFGLRQTSIRYAALHPPKRGETDIGAVGNCSFKENLIQGRK